MGPDDRKDDQIEDGVLGIARGPAPQTDADRALGRESDERTGREPDPGNTSLDNEDTGTGYGVPKGPGGLHVED